MRKIIAFLFVAASLFAVGYHNQWWSSTDPMLTASVDNKFIVLQNDKDSAMLADRRQECGDLRAQVSQLNTGDQTSQENDLEYDEVLGDMVDHLIYENVIPRKCVVFVANSKTVEMLDSFEGGGAVVLSTSGDIAIGYRSRPTTTWMQVQFDDAWHPDMLSLEDGTTLEIVSGRG